MATKTSPTTKTTKRPSKKTTSRNATVTRKTTASAKTKQTAKSSPVPPVIAIPKPRQKISFSSLNKYNLIAALLHAVQGAAVLLLSSPDRGIQQITTNYLTLDQLATKAAGKPQLVQATRHVFDVNLAYFVAAFFFMSAIAHVIIATVYRKRYEADLATGINKLRWFEYAISASTMMVAIGFLSGIFDISTLLAIFALDAVMNLMGLAMELHNRGRENVQWFTYIVGCIAGIVPWFIFAIYVWGAQVYGSGVPGFVYGIYASIFVFFNCFAINMFLQYKKIGPWKNYLFGERTYIILSLVAKTALAWQVFAGTLRP